MSLTEHLEIIDSMLAKGKLVDSAKEYYDKSIVTHIQNFITNKGKSAINDLQRVEERIQGGSVEILASRAIEEDHTTVSLLSLEGPATEDGKFKLLLLVARKWNDKEKITEEEYLPVRSAADAQTYFPDTRIGSKQIQPRLSFVSPTRKRRGKGGGRPPKPVSPTDLFRLPTVGKSVIDAFNNVGLTTFEKLSKAKDDLLETVKENSGRRFVNFDVTYWRTAAEYAVKGEWDKIPPPPKAAKKVGKREAKIDFSTVGDHELDKMPKVGPGMLAAMMELGLDTYSKLAQVTEEQLAILKEKGGRPFVNFDMSYFRKAAQKKVDGAKTLPAPPKPKAPKAKKTGRVGRKPKAINPNDLHVLPGVGAQLIKALQDAGLNTFADVADADKTTLKDARSLTKGKYKNIDLGFLKRMAKYAAAGNFDKLTKEVKIEKAAQPAAVSAADRHLAKLQAADKSDLEVLPGIGASVKAAMNEANIKTFAQLAKAKEERLTEIAANAGKRFARFDVSFWKKVAAHAHAGEFDQIPLKPPTAPKPKAKKRGGKRAPRTARPPRTPKSNSDLGALPTIGATIIKALHANNINTFAQLASSSDAKLEAVRAASGPKYKTFPIAYWREIATLAKDGNYDYPPRPKKEKEKPAAGKRGRKPKAIAPTNLRAIPGVGASMAAALRANGLTTWEEIVNAEAWVISKSASEAGRRFANLNPEELRQKAKNALSGKFDAPKRARSKSKLPEGAEKLTELPGIGAKVQEKLFERKILTYADLSKATIGLLEEVRDEVGRRVAKANVRDWKAMATLATQGKWSEIDPSKFEEDAPAEKAPKRPRKPKDGDDLTKIKGIGPQAQQLFRSRGVKTYQAILDLSDDALMALLEDSSARVAPKDFAKVQEAAAKALSKPNKASAKKAPAKKATTKRKPRKKAAKK